MLDLEIRHFKLMVALAKTENMTRAAEVLRLTQSALSHQLKDAEERVGTPLFVRKNQRLSLTPAGRHMVDLSREMIEKLNHGTKSIREIANIETRVLRIKTVCYTSFSWLPSIFKAYLDCFPRVKIEMGGTYDDVQPAIKKNKVDIGITTEDITDKNLTWEPLFEDELLLIMSPTHHLAKKTILHPKELDGESIVIYNISDEDSTLITGILKPAGAKPGLVTRVEITEGIVELVKAGLGIGILADWAAAPHLKDGTLVTRPVGSRGFKRTWKAVTRKNDSELPHIREFMRLLKESLRK